MDRLPDEIVVQILSFLNASELISCQQVSRRLLSLCRDNNLWKQACFDASRAGFRRHRAEQQEQEQQRRDAPDEQLEALRAAVTGLSTAGLAQERVSYANRSSGRLRLRALANWDPAYPHERVDYYEEYIHRHADINIGWLATPSQDPSDDSEPSEAVGVGLLQDLSSGSPRHVVAPLDDGSVCIWDVQARSTGESPKQGSLAGRSTIGLLSGTSPHKHNRHQIRDIMTEVGAVETVSIDSTQNKGYFAQNNTLVEVDLATLQVVSHELFPFPITALSETRQHSLVVGTNFTVHVHDPRNKSTSPVDPSRTVEVIGGPTANHASLSQPGPLSILNRLEDDSIWVAGRFTHLLNYDRRFFPRLRGTVHSGARISCIATLPFSTIPRTMDLLKDPSLAINELYTAKSAPGCTLLAAGEYKGKGSLEHYSLSTSLSGPRSLYGYQNRQTASSTKLLSVASHDLSTVFSDGNGNLKWVERDGSTPIRSYNINEPMTPPSFNQAQSSAQLINAPEAGAQGDIVQKIIPLLHHSSGFSNSKRADINQTDLLLKTGDGRIGILGFGSESLYGREELVGVTESTEERARKDAEKSYQNSMGRLLRRQADVAKTLDGMFRAAFSRG
ncbi:hypothetical protein AAFC00_003121 [Neodothiora populina]|uniref:F-box domain-containing protein n=1 Tax=Neodothiora populina TaxID=2781224 RepID=A0ABR3P9D6_9PEZI